MQELIYTAEQTAYISQIVVRGFPKKNVILNDENVDAIEIIVSGDFPPITSYDNGVLTITPPDQTASIQIQSEGGQQSISITGPNLRGIQIAQGGGNIRQTQSIFGRGQRSSPPKITITYPQHIPVSIQ